MLRKEVIEKYNVPSPRYTSYPTILDWNRTSFDLKEFKQEWQKEFQNLPESQAVSVYIHLPYCESLCTFCGCHKHITKNHLVETPYIDALIREWKLYKAMNNNRNFQVAELHLGGGTPTFFSAGELERLLNVITENTAQQKNFSVEGHPNHTSEEQMSLFYQYGFRRISFGVQDYDATVQKAINRIQSFEQVKYVTDTARKIGFTAISHDLVFGLPFQSMTGLKDSVEKTIALKPDNISLYSYAHVPWVKGTGQRGFSEEDIPKGTEKRALYEMAKAALLKAGYLEIGMDHFGLPTEELAIAMQNAQLNRNFMGYTTAKSERLIGLGASAISEYQFGYAQNLKSIKDYLQALSNNQLPVFKGHIHSPEDHVMKRHIKSLMCNFETEYCEHSILAKQEQQLKNDCQELVDDGILAWENNKLQITQAGKPFVRNVCMQLDPYNRRKALSNRFSQSI